MKRFLAGALFVAVLVGTIALAKSDDLLILMKAGRKAREQVTAALPDGRRLAGPLAAFRPGDALPVEERVRVRIQTDKAMAGADVSVVATGNAGEVRLRGIVRGGDQRARAIELASGTTGVDAVLAELAIPEGP
jgi:hypothetical protein